VRNAPSIFFFVVPQEVGHNNLFLQEALMNKYIGFDIDSKKIVACVVENGKKDIYQTLKSDIGSMRKFLEKQKSVGLQSSGGYEDTNDAERLSVDPAMRHVVGERAKDKTAASVGQMGRFETEILTQPRNLKALINQTGKWVDEVHQRKSIQEIILDMDSSDSPTFGKQEGSAYNGHSGFIFKFILNHCVNLFSFK